MLLEIIKFELLYRIKRPDTYLYFLIIFVSGIFAVDFFYNGSLGNISENAPYIIAKTMAIVAAGFMIITSMIMGVSVMRDFDHHMESLMFVNPIKKIDYLLGRFFGSFIVLVFIFSGLLLGMIASELLPWKNEATLLPLNLWNYINPFLYIVIPSIFFSGALFFASGAISRKLIVVYTQGILLYIFYLLAISYSRGASDRFLAALLDPFALETINSIVQFWTPNEKNLLTIPMDGILLYNRILWVSIGILALVIINYVFSFTINKNSWFSRKKEQNENTESSYAALVVPSIRTSFGLKSKLKQLQHSAMFHLKTILVEIPFWAIVVCGTVIIFINSIYLGTSYDVKSYPTTYLVVEELQENAIFFFLMILIFYSGELIWKERNIKINFVVDALPTVNFINVLGKYFGLIGTYLILIVALIISGITFQAFNGYYKFELIIYIVGFFGQIFLFLLMYSTISFFIHIVLNHKLISHLFVILIFIITIAIENLGYSHGLYRFGGIDLQPYSDMNGYGHFTTPYIWFSIYWLIICTILLITSQLFIVRGTESVFNYRWRQAKLRLDPKLIKTLTFCLIVLSVVGGYIFYNTNILNAYSNENTQLEFRATYEKTLKKYEKQISPKIVDVNLKIDLYPHERDYKVEGYYILSNTNNTSLNEIHIQKLPREEISLEKLSFNQQFELKESFELYGYYIYELEKPLQPGDSIKMDFTQIYHTKGFNHSENTNVVYNGTFFNNSSLLTLGYNDDMELKIDKERIQFDLSPYEGKANLLDSTAIYRGGMAGDDGDEINFEIIIGTHKDQIAIAPGYLQKEWELNGRNYYHYKMDKPMSNFYSIVSADYEVRKDEYRSKTSQSEKGINLEIFYQKGHEYNLDRMMNGMKKSFAYYNKNFSPYQYQQMRILEIPGYKDGAQSYPNTVPFSEKIGFILDVNDDEDVDIPFYVTAHELAHQWWGHLVNPADVEGKTMIAESLAQYSALMVLKKEYPDKILQFIDKQTRDYLTGRTAEEKKEHPLKSVESNQTYIHYGKGLVNFNALQHYISEDSVNLALKRYINDWNSFTGVKKLATGRYSTTQDLLGYIKNVTPDSLQYLVKDLFEEITTYDHRIEEFILSETTNNASAINLMISFKKYQTDSEGIEKLVTNNDYVEIAFYGSDNREISRETIFINESQKEISMILNEIPAYAILDPNHLLIEKNREDNIVRFK